MQIKLLENNLSVRKSKTGRGLFANVAFKTNDLICELKGKIITCFEDDNIDEKIRSNTIRYSTKYYLSPQGELGDYLNHSCVPNAFIIKTGKKMFLKAAEKILSDVEITIDYSTIIAPDDIWKMNCHCRNKNCRKVISGFNSLPSKIRDNYLSRNMVPSYIYKHGR